MKWMFKLGLAMLMVVTSLSAAQRFYLADFEDSKYGIDGSFVTIDDHTYARTAWQPDFSWRGFELGVNVNIYIPFDSNAPYPNDLEFLTLRHVAYSNQNVGFKWGRLTNVTLGQGLLMSNYDSGMGETGVFTTRKAGFLGHVQYNGYRLDAIYTGTNVQGARVSGPIPKLKLFYVPFYVGATYLQDSNGVDFVQDGQRVIRPAQEGIAADLFWPLGGSLLTFFGEYAQLNDRLDRDASDADGRAVDGNGASVGVRGDFLGMFYYRAAYMRLGEGFIPSYFNSVYETTSLQAGDALTEAAHGYKAGAGASFMGGQYRLGVDYERIADRNLLSTNAGWSKIGPTSGVINYVVPYQGNENRVMQADINYRSAGGAMYTFHLKRVYTTDDDYIETFGVSTRMDVRNLF